MVLKAICITCLALVVSIEAISPQVVEDHDNMTDPSSNSSENDNPQPRSLLDNTVAETFSPSDGTKEVTPSIPDQLGGQTGLQRLNKDNDKNMTHTETNSDEDSINTRFFSLKSLVPWAIDALTGQDTTLLSNDDPHAKEPSLTPRHQSTGGAMGLQQQAYGQQIPTQPTYGQQQPGQQIPMQQAYGQQQPGQQIPMQQAYGQQQPGQQIPMRQAYGQQQPGQQIPMQQAYGQQQPGQQIPMQQAYGQQQPGQQIPMQQAYGQQQPGQQIPMQQAYGQQQPGQQIPMQQAYGQQQPGQQMPMQQAFGQQQPGQQPPLQQANGQQQFSQQPPMQQAFGQQQPGQQQHSQHIPGQQIVGQVPMQQVYGQQPGQHVSGQQQFWPNPIGNPGTQSQVSGGGAPSPNILENTDLGKYSAWIPELEILPD